MNEKQVAEVKFWRDLFDLFGEEAFLSLRAVADFDGKRGFFPELCQETGKGLDYGCGLVSVFEGSGLDIDAYDPLQDEYDAIYRHDGDVRYTAPQGPYDFVCCFNVIDHTPDPTTIVDDLTSLLKPGGHLYFEVNFDPELYCAHWSLWHREEVELYMSRFTLLRERLTDNPDAPGQQHYEALYIRP